MGTNRRVLRFEREIRELVSSFLISEFRGQLPVFVSVPMVQASGDLKSAKVYISVIGPGANVKSYDSCVEILNKNAYEVQRYVAKKLDAKFCPKLRFYSDERQQAAMKVDTLIHETFPQDKKTDEFKDDEE